MSPWFCMPEACTEVYKEKRQPEKAPSQLYMQLTHTVKPRIALHLPMTVRDLFDHEPREYFPAIIPSAQFPFSGHPPCPARPGRY